jgi:hypothetical protein
MHPENKRLSKEKRCHRRAQYSLGEKLTNLVQLFYLSSSFAVPRKMVQTVLYSNNNRQEKKNI